MPAYTTDIILFLQRLFIIPIDIIRKSSYLRRLLTLRYYRIIRACIVSSFGRLFDMLALLHDFGVLVGNERLQLVQDELDAAFLHLELRDDEFELFLFDLEEAVEFVLRFLRVVAFDGDVHTELRHLHGDSVRV